MTLKTSLYEEHLALHGKIVDFAGWAMPLHYGSQIIEHQKVREDAGMFDVSHMMVVDLSGQQVKQYLRFLLANDVAKLNLPGKALYTCMLNNQGGVIDDLIVYYQDDTHYRLVVNAATRAKDLKWLKLHAEEFKVEVKERSDLSIIAIQGPQARAKTNLVFSEKQKESVNSLKIFQGVESEGLWIARTGYTGEDGYEIIVPNNVVIDFWRALIQKGITPCGLGARDTLRLEAGLNLYGTDMDESTSPLESNLAWTVAFTPEDRNFIGQEALIQQQKMGLKKVLVGLVYEGRGILRNHQKVSIPNLGEGEITSGSFSPTLGKSIAFARIPNAEATECLVEIRGHWMPAKIVKPPFISKQK